MHSAMAPLFVVAVGCIFWFLITCVSQAVALEQTSECYNKNNQCKYLMFLARAADVSDVKSSCPTGCGVLFGVSAGHPCRWRSEQGAEPLGTASGVPPPTLPAPPACSDAAARPPPTHPPPHNPL